MRGLWLGGQGPAAGGSPWSAAVFGGVCRRAGQTGWWKSLPSGVVLLRACGFRSASFFHCN